MYNMNSFFRSTNTTLFVLAGLIWLSGCGGGGGGSDNGNNNSGNGSSGNSSVLITTDSNTGGSISPNSIEITSGSTTI